MLLTAASSLAVNGSVAFAEDAADSGALILSSTAGAMLPPNQWNCDRYVAEYRDFLDAGNSPSSWRFYGKRYRTTDTGEVYDWPMWLKWQASAKCAQLSPTQSAASEGGGGFGGMTAVGVVAGLLGTGAIAAGGGGGGGDEKPTNKSPG